MIGQIDIGYAKTRGWNCKCGEEILSEDNDKVVYLSTGRPTFQRQHHNLRRLLQMSSYKICHAVTRLWNRSGRHGCYRPVAAITIFAGF